jgi:nucleoside-diphosphate-sugar epimerase
VIAGASVVINLGYDFAAPADELLSDFDALIQACEKAKVAGFVQFSSIAVYDGWPGADLDETSPCDGPGGAYKLVKRAMERRLANAQLPHSILQPTIVYGAGSPQWTEKILDQARSGQIVLPDGAEGLCHAVHVDDVVGATIRAARLEQHTGGRFIVSGPRPVGWRTFYAAHLALIGIAPPVLEPLSTSLPLDVGAARTQHRAVREAVRLVRSLLPQNAAVHLKRSLAAMARLGRPARHYPSAGELLLLRARGSCRTARAGHDLGFDPQIDFERGIELIGEARDRRR